MNPFRRWFQLNGFGRVIGVDRFWRKVVKTTDPAACWPWANGRCGCGYGAVRWQGRQMYAHRLAYELVNGPIPPGLLVRHLCDNPLCCRPSHLALGTHADNMADMARRGRRRAHVLGATMATAIRQRGEPAPILAAEYGVTPTAIHQVRRGEIYRSIA